MHDAYNRARMASVDPIDLYPIIIREARYGGTYEGGVWVAFSNAETGLPESAFGDDNECLSFWKSTRSDLVGRGNTPNDAYDDLIYRHATYTGPSRPNGMQLLQRTNEATAVCSDPQIRALLHEIAHYLGDRI